MLLSRSVALSILATLGVQGLVIPSVDSIVDAVVHKVEGEVSIADETANKPEPKGKAEAKSSVAPLQVNPNTISHKYIIVLKDNISPEEFQFHREWVSSNHIESLKDLTPDNQFFLSASEYKAEGGIIDSFDIDSLIKGYYGYFLDSTIELIRKNPLVKFVEADSVVFSNEFNIQKGAPWGLARVSHRPPLSLNSFNQYLYDNDGGKGVTSYIIDTGVNIHHEDFNGRAKWGKTIPTGDADEDDNGHGSHCAGTIGSSTYGVAKNADLVAVKVLRSNGSGSMSDVIKGVEFAAKSHQAAVKEGKKGFKGSTANMSLGGGKSPALDLTVNAAVKAGLHFAVAAGNENQDACNVSPAGAENAVTVGASTISDARAYFSNYGKCVDIFAPGLNILSTYTGSTTATATLSGTSMASPHIAGLLAYYLSLQPDSDSEFFSAGKGISTSELKKNLIKYGTDGLLSDIPDDGTPNVLAFNGAGKNLTHFWQGNPEVKVASTKNAAEKDSIMMDNVGDAISFEIERVLTEVSTKVSGTLI